MIFYNYRVELAHNQQKFNSKTLEKEEQIELALCWASEKCVSLFSCIPENLNKLD